jgi:DNA-binding CsgD family transcriptional regulator
VATAFIGEPLCENHQVNHIDGNKLNNRVDNLNWLSPLENRQHAIDNHLHHRGESHKSSKLTEAQVIEIIKSSDSNKVLAQRFSISPSSITAIKKGRRWRWLYEKINNQG